MKISLYCLLFFCLLAASNGQQCSIPANCENYTVSIQKCTSCQKNYLLFNGNCISILTLTSLINQQTQQSTQPTATPSQTSTHAASTTPAPLPKPIPNYTPIPIFTPTSTPTSTPTPISIQQATTTINTQTQKQTTFVPWYSLQGATQFPTSQTQYGYTQSSSSQSAPSKSSPTLYGFTSSTQTTTSGSYTDLNCKKTDSTNSFCVQCYSFYYPSSTLNKCCPVNPLCKDYTLQNQCTSCYSGYDLINGNCVISQSQSTSSSQGSVNAYDNCKTYTYNVCSECYSNFYYNTTLSQCLPTNPNCKTVTSTNQCTSCYNGYQLNTNTGNCDLQAASSSSATSTSSSSTTSSNQPGNQNGGSQYVTSNGYIYQITSQGQWIGPLSNVPADPNCLVYNNGYCVSCAPRYYLTSSGCASVDPNCNNWTTNGVCQQCQTGYSLSNNICVQPSSSQNAQNGQTASSGSQTGCYPPRQILINQVCKTVSDLCKSWSNTTAACTDCYTGYHLNNGVCQ